MTWAAWASRGENNVIVLLIGDYSIPSYILQCFVTSKIQRRKKKHSKCNFVFVTWHTFGSILLLLCCIWRERRRGEDWVPYKSKTVDFGCVCILTFLCHSCTAVLYLELKGHPGLDHTAKNIWTIALKEAGKTHEMQQLSLYTTWKQTTKKTFDCEYLLTRLVQETTATVECPNKYSRCCWYLGDKFLSWTLPRKVAITATVTRYWQIRDLAENVKIHIYTVCNDAKMKCLLT